MDRLKVDDSSFLLKGGNYVLSYAISTHKPFTQDCLLSHDTQYIQWQYKSWTNERGGACSNHCRALNVVCCLFVANQQLLRNLQMKYDRAPFLRGIQCA